MNLTKVSAAAIGICLAAGLSACGSSSGGGPSYHSNGVSLSTPSGWQDSTQQAKKSSMMGDRVAFAAGDGVFKHAQNEMNLIVTDTHGQSLTESSFKKSVVPGLSSEHAKYQGTVSVDGVTGYKVSATTTSSDGRTVPTEQVYVVHQPDLYIFTFASTQGSDGVASDADNILQTVKWQ